MIKKILREFENWIRGHTELVIVIILSSLFLIDLSGFDAIFYKILCSPFEQVSNKVNCPDFYDIPFWTFLESMGSLLAVMVAVWAGLHAIKQANRQEKNSLEIQMDQDMPIIFLNPGPRLHKSGTVRLDLINVGKGIAKDVYVYMDNVLIDGNFSMHTKSPSNSAQSEIKVIDTSALPEKMTELSRIAKQSQTEEILMKIKYRDLHGRPFVTEGITFKKNNMGNFDHDRGKWSFRKAN